MRGPSRPCRRWGVPAAASLVTCRTKKRGAVIRRYSVLLMFWMNGTHRCLPEIDDAAVVLRLAEVTAWRVGAGGARVGVAAGGGVARGPEPQRRGVARTLLGQHQHIPAVRYLARRDGPARRVHRHERTCRRTAIVEATLGSRQRGGLANLVWPRGLPCFRSHC